MSDLGGWHIGVYLMIAIDVAAVVSLGIAIAYGTRMWREATGPGDRQGDGPRNAAPLPSGHDKPGLR